jgi:gamma-butyrobetaine dioxygenase
MKMTALEVRPDALLATWSKTGRVAYPTLWLRDNCPSAFHPQTEERVLDLLTLDSEPVLLNAERAGETVVLSYADGHVSHVPMALLSAHRPGRTAADPAAIQPRLWRDDLTPGAVPRYAAAQILESDCALRAWMQDTAAYGLSIVDRLDDRVNAGIEVACKIGFLRETNFGMTFEVVSKPDPNNLAYTAVTLPLHTRPAPIRKCRRASSSSTASPTRRSAAARSSPMASPSRKTCARAIPKPSAC